MLIIVSTCDSAGRKGQSTLMKAMLLTRQTSGIAKKLYPPQNWNVATCLRRARMMVT